jgi:hypothetical protein
LKRYRVPARPSRPPSTDVARAITPLDHLRWAALGEVADVVDGEGGGRKLTAANAEVETTHEPLISSVYA